MGLEWIGILMGAFSILYILSLFSYSTADPPLNSNNLVNGYNNMIGPVGAYLAYISFITIGMLTKKQDFMMFDITSWNLMKI